MSRLLRRRYLPLVALLGAGVAVVATLAQGASSGSVHADDNFYMPSSIAITPMGTVTFSEGGSNHHNVHFDSASVPDSCTNNNSAVGSWVGPSGNTSAPSTTGSNAAWSSTCTFNSAGTYTFHCDVHKFTGTVYVNASGTVPSTTTTTPPTTTGGGGTTGTTPPPSTTTGTTSTPGTTGGAGGGRGGAAGGGGSGVGSGGGAGGGPAGGPSAGAALGALTLASSQKGGSVHGTVSVTEGGSTLTVDLLAPGASLARAKGGATASAGHLVRRSVGPGRVSFTVPLNAKARKALRRHRRLALTVKVRVTGPGGQTGTRTTHVTVHR